MSSQDTNSITTTKPFTRNPVVLQRKLEASDDRNTELETQVFDLEIQVSELKEKNAQLEVQCAESKCKDEERKKQLRSSGAREEAASQRALGQEAELIKVEANNDRLQRINSNLVDRLVQINKLTRETRVLELHRLDMLKRERDIMNQQQDLLSQLDSLSLGTRGLSGSLYAPRDMKEDLIHFERGPRPRYPHLGEYQTLHSPARAVEQSAMCPQGHSKEANQKNKTKLEDQEDVQAHNQSEVGATQKLRVPEARLEAKNKQVMKREGKEKFQVLDQSDEFREGTWYSKHDSQRVVSELDRLADRFRSVDADWTG